ncbi:hypothetical protein SH528x_000412 [Novipirellula sp. SH528]|uniref:hypothetical protein n=1 Tax=Novipirellula sp. SH528 TaxID=3454466 RepID=UPI003FA12BAE
MSGSETALFSLFHLDFHSVATISIGTQKRHLIYWTNVFIAVFDDVAIHPGFLSQKVDVLPKIQQVGLNAKGNAKEYKTGRVESQDGQVIGAAFASCSLVDRRLRRAWEEP